MPIDYSEYHPKWSLISRLIRTKRAKNKCEWCGITNGSIIKREGTTFRYACQTDLDMIYSRIKYSHSNLTESLQYHGFTKIVLTVSHLDHDKTNNRFENLAALCQKCHLSHDIHEHVNNRKYGRNYKKNQLKLDL
ncbi:MAG: hypothetical protein QHC79_09660 [Pseudosphingobacterium sp.]|nr:hypothetical protein [Pseudosphingobacterium sp.]